MSRRSAPVVCAFAALAAGMLFVAPSTDSSPLPRYRPQELIVKFRSGVDVAEKQSLRATLDGRTLRHLESIDADLLRLRELTVSQALARYGDDPRFELLEPNFLVETQALPDDTAFHLQWGLHNTGLSGGVPGADIAAVDAWDLFTGSRDVVVAVIDTGVDYTHPDLADNVWINTGEIADNGIDDDGNGFVDDVRGWDCRNGDNDPMDDHGHGTHVAGTVGAIGNNALGVAGVAWNVQLLPLKFLGPTGFGTIADAIGCIDYAVAAGAPILSNSWGGSVFSEALQLAIARSHEAGALFVAAAGNNGDDLDVEPFYPASYDMANVISVAATDDNDRLAEFSNYGATSVHIAAPGSRIYSTSLDHGYKFLSGTSMATPHVAGTLALILGRFPGIDTTLAHQLLFDRADRLEDLAGRLTTGARLNAQAPLLGSDDEPPARIVDLTLDEIDAARARLTWTATGDDGLVGTAARVDVRFDTVPLDESNFDLATRAADGFSPAPAGQSQLLDVEGLAFETTYYFAARAQDEHGNRSPISNVVSGTTLGPPAMEVHPNAFVESLHTGALLIRTLELSNPAVGELTWRIDVESGDPPADLTLLLLHAGSDLVSLGDQLRELADVADVELFDVGDATPTVDRLRGYDAVIVSASDAFDDPPALGDLLADYVDEGGGLVLSQGTFHVDRKLEGRFENQRYSPLADGVDTVTGSFLDARDVDHPILDGVRSLTGTRLAHAVPTPGAIRVVDWAFGEPLVATQGVKVAAINLDLDGGEHWTGDVPRLLGNAARWVADGVSWLSTVPARGRLPGGTTAGIDMRFEPIGLIGGDYRARLVVRGNAPGTPELSVHVDLRVTGAPDLELATEAIDFGEIFAGAKERRAIQLSNTGTETLTLTQIAPQHPWFSASLSSLVLPPRRSVELVITFRPATPGEIVAPLVLISNDPDHPQLTIELRGTGLPPPELQITPDELRHQAFSDTEHVRTLTLSNTGDHELTYRVELEAPIESPSPDWQPFSFYEGFEAGDLDRWTDTGTSNLKQITDVTAARDEASLHQVNAETRQQGGVFRDLGNVRPRHVSFHVRSGSVDTNDGFFVLSDADGEELVWFYARDGGAFSMNASSGGNASVPYAAGAWYEIAMKNVDFETHQYDYWVDGELVTAGVGMRNAERIDGLGRIDLYNFDSGSEAWWDEVFMYRGIGVLPVAGTIPPGGEVEITLNLDATGLRTAHYPATLRILSNDPDDGDVSVPLVLEVITSPTLVPGPDVDFGHLFFGAPVEQTLLVENQGTLDLVVSDVAWDNPDFAIVPTAFTVPGETTFPLRVVFDPLAPGASETRLSFTSNDPRTPPTVGVRGETVLPPRIELAPTAVEQHLFVGQIENRLVALANTGVATLEYQAEIELVDGPGPPPVMLGETFEDGTHDGWVAISPHNLLEVTDETGADGSRHSLHLKNDIQVASGVYRELGLTRLTTLRFWVATSSRWRNEGRVIVRDADGVAAINFLATDAGHFRANGRWTGFPHQPHRWYPIELREIDQDAREFDVYINGQAALFDVPFFGGRAGAPLRRIELTNVDVDAESWWDEIQAIGWSTAVSVEPTAGTVPAGESGYLTVRLDARSLMGGHHDARLRVRSNDPRHPETVIPLSFTVEGLATTRLSADALDFGEVRAGETHTLTIAVANDGTEPLTITSVDADRPEFTTNGDGLRVELGDSGRIRITFAPRGGGPVEGTLTLRSNDHRGDLQLPVRGAGVAPPPRVDITDGAVVATLPPRSERTREREIAVGNAGSGSLVWRAEVDRSWVRVSPATGAIAPDGTATLAVTFASAALPSGEHSATLRLETNDPQRPVVTVPLTLIASEVEVDHVRVDFTPKFATRPGTVEVVIQLPAPYHPRDVLVSSIVAMGEVSAEPFPVQILDLDRDRIPELIVQFDARRLEALLPRQRQISIAVVGEVENLTWFTGRTTVRGIALLDPVLATETEIDDKPD